MAIASQRFLLSATPTLIGNEKTRVLVTVPSGVGIGLGGPSVSSDNSYPLTGPIEKEFILERGEFLYAIGSVTIFVLTRE